jgi:hypothetical protein
MNLQIIFPLINPNESTLKTLNSIIGQTHENFNIDIFINDYSEKDDQFIKSNEIFKNKKIRIFRFYKNYGQLNNMKKCLRNINQDFFMIATNGIIYSRNYLLTLIKEMKDENVVLSTCEFYIADHNNNILAQYPKTKRLYQNNYSKNKFFNHLIFVNNIVSAGTKINGIFRSSVLKKIKMIKNLDWDRVFVYQVSLLGKVFHTEEVLASKLVRKDMLKSIEIRTDFEFYEKLKKEIDIDFFKLKTKLNFRSPKKNKIILISNKWVSSPYLLKYLEDIAKINDAKKALVNVKYDYYKTYHKQLDSNFFKVKPRYINYSELYNLYLYSLFAFRQISSLRDFWWFIYSTIIVLYKGKIYRIKNIFLKKDFLKEKIKKNFYLNLKKKYKLINLNVRSLSDPNKEMLISGATKSSLCLIEKIKKKNDISLLQPLVISNKQILNEELKSKLNDNIDYVIFHKTMEIDLFKQIKKKIVLVSHNIEYKHYIKKKILNFIVKTYKKKLLIRNKNLLESSIKFNLLKLYSLVHLNKKSIIRYFKELFNAYYIYKNSRIILNTFLNYDLLNLIFLKKIYKVPPVLYNDNKYKKQNFNVNSIYISCIGSGKKSVYGDFQLLMFLNILNLKFNFFFKNNQYIKFLITGELDCDLKNYLKSKFINLHITFLSQSDSLENFLNRNLVINLLVDENSTGIRTKFYDTILNGNYTFFLNERQMKRETFLYENIMETDLVNHFNFNDYNKLLNLIDKIKNSNLTDLKIKNLMIAENYNNQLNDLCKLNLSFLKV